MQLAPSAHREYVQQYQQHLYEEERSPSTIQQYTRAITAFLHFIQDRPLTKGEVLAFKERLVGQYAPSSVNAMLAAVNGFLDWLAQAHCKVKPLRIQKSLFLSPERELTEGEYRRLIRTAEQAGKHKLSLVIQTICATGIRVSELRSISVSALQSGQAAVYCKGKNRIVFLPKALCNALKGYCKARHITAGPIFVTRSGAPLDRSNIWKMMKGLCQMANVAQSKVFPHNLRHLFAYTYYKIEKDIGRLADILGHSSVNTTRIYTMETGLTHAQQLDRMNLTYYRR